MASHIYAGLFYCFYFVCWRLCWKHDFGMCSRSLELFTLIIDDRRIADECIQIHEQRSAHNKSTGTFYILQISTNRMPLNGRLIRKIKQLSVCAHTTPNREQDKKNCSSRKTAIAYQTECKYVRAKGISFKIFCIIVWVLKCENVTAECPVCFLSFPLVSCSNADQNTCCVERVDTTWLLIPNSA